MLWSVRTTLEDRPGALAELTGRCGRHGINILSLQMFPHLGRVTDEVVLSAPDDWDAGRIRTLVVASGGDQVAVRPCSERDLVDAPTAYLRAGLQLLDAPSALADVLEDLVDAHVSAVDASGPGDVDTLRVEVAGAVTEVWRTVPFTPSEHARAAALARFSERAVQGSPDPAAVVGDWVARPARPSDAAAVRRLHGRSSVETLSRRYHAPMLRVPHRWEQQLLAPAGGASYVAAVGDEVVGMVVLAPHEGDTLEIGLLVEDGWQRRGIGSRLLHLAATHGAGRGARALVALMQPDNRALLPTVRRCGLTCRVEAVDDAVQLTIPLGRITPRPGSAAPPADDAARMTSSPV